MNLSSRLNTINNLVTKRYLHVWDCCCDHGFLGMALVKRAVARKVHFVDIIEPLMNELSHSLQSLNDPNAWKVHCLDVAQLPLLEEEQALKSEMLTLNETILNDNSHLIIIAGVGGERLIELMEGIIANHSARHLEFILCPVHHNYKVREYLTEQSIGLIKEVLVKENKRFYEVLYVSTQSHRKVSLIGDEMWNLDNVDHQLYLKRTIEHYQLKRNDPTIDAKKILSLYKALIV